MELITKTISDSLPPALKAYRPAKLDVKHFIDNLKKYLAHIDSKESEENLKTHLMDFLKPSYAPEHTVEQYGDIDFVIRKEGKGTSAAVLFEVKREANKADMIRKDDINRKALHELILYFMRQRKAGNTDILHLIICTEFEFFIFKASQFERLFFRNAAFHKDFIDWDAGQKSDCTTNFFYREIAKDFISSNNNILDAIYIDLREYQSKFSKSTNSKELVKLFKLLGPYFLLNKKLANDSNSLNKLFYDELMHLIGLEERKDGTRRVIGRLEETKRKPGSLLENTINLISFHDYFYDEKMISNYGNSKEKREFNIALELCLTWVNRLLFLKLLEAQIIKFHGQDNDYKFLTTYMVTDFAELSELYFKVLAFKPSERPSHIKIKYEKIPYLNSSLFEQTQLEKKFMISSLSNTIKLSIFDRTVLKESSGSRPKGDKSLLPYIFEFLDAYDFGTVGGNEVQEENKTIINAAVLGLIFEKINGYQNGAIFTPGYVTMYMARKSIEKTVLEAFQKKYSKWILNDIDDIKNNIIDRSKVSILELNSVIDGLKICDPAVGSGHFLVSCLNELIAIKSRLKILADAQGNRISNYYVEVDNDELIIMHTETDEIFAYKLVDDLVPKNVQHVQQILFHEKQKLIENCLFGVDINANSVGICQLRLWIELLKSAYYREGTDGQLETLPNIDINIKCGNSLLSRFSLDQNLSEAFKKAKLTVSEYRKLVNDYKTTKDKTVKRNLQDKISQAKMQFQEEELERLTKAYKLEIAKLKAKEAQNELFPDDEKLEATREKIKKLESKKETSLQRKTFLGALEWRFEFPEVLDDKGKFVGFDLVIANPPYGVKINEPVLNHLTSALGKVPDYEIYYFFINLASKILKHDGSTCQIIPNTILFNYNAKLYRELLLNDWKDLKIDDLTAFSVFDGIVVRNIILHGRRRIGNEGIAFKRTMQDHDIAPYLLREVEHASKKTLFENIKNWGLVFKLEPNVMKLVSKIRDSNGKLKEVFPNISQGLISYDKYKGQSDKIIKTRAYHSQTSSTLNSPWLNGRDVTRFKVKWNGKEYVEYSSKLANPRKPEFFKSPRILIREITNPRIYAAFTDKELYNDPALINILVEKDKKFNKFALLGIFNSKVVSFFHFNSSPKATKGAFPKILVDDIKTLPLPNAEGKKELIQSISKRTSNLMVLVEKNSTAEEFKLLDQQNEQDIYKLYGLSEDDISIIEDFFEKMNG
jgi:adenine-specific DNA-methyltransferase